MSDADVMIVSATGLLALGLPLLLSAWAERRTPTVALALMIGALALLAWTWSNGDLASWRDVPDAFVRAIGAMVN